MQIAQVEWTKLFQTRPRRSLPDGHCPILLSFDNQRQNDPWGDQLTEKENATTRIYSLNLKGIGLDRQGGQFDTLCAITKNSKHILFVAKDITWIHRKQLCIAFYTIHCNIIGKDFVCKQVSTQQSIVQWYKPGGTLMFSVGNITGHIMGQFQDQWNNGSLNL